MESKAMDEILAYLRFLNINFIERTIPYRRGEMKILYIKQIVDMTALSEQIIKPIVQYVSASGKTLKAGHTMEDIIYAADCRLQADTSKVHSHILAGMVVLLFSNDPQYVVVDIKQVARRNVSEPEITYTIRGPRDCFVETLDVNLSLIRYRLKDPSLRIEMMEVGKRTKTSVAMIYMEDIANDTVVTEIKKRIGDISIDSIWGTAELQHFLQNSKHNLFPLLGTTERSDWACEAVVEGRVVILADGGHIALIAPHIFADSMNACDDRYDNKFFGFFSRILRYMALYMVLCPAAQYIAIVSFHSYILPLQYTILLSQLRQNVLFSPLVEVLLLELLVELIRESLLRVPQKIGVAIGVVGAIIIGQAATSAGVFSPLLLIIVSAELMASFAIPDYFSVHPFRILKFLVILMTGSMGFYGFILALTVILISMFSLNSFGAPYMAPFAPYNRYDYRRALMFSRATSPWRQQFLRPKDDTRTNFYHQNMEPK